MPASRLVILGASGHGVSACNVALSAGFDVTQFVDPALRGGKLLGIDIVGDLSELADAGNLQVFIAIGDNDTRCRVHSDISAQYPGMSFPSLIHASAVVSYFASIGDG